MSGKVKLKRRGLLTTAATFVTAFASVASAKASPCSVTNRALGTKLNRVVAVLAATVGVLWPRHGFSDGRGSTISRKTATSLLRRRCIAFAGLLAPMLLVLASPAVSAAGRGNISGAAMASAAPADLWPEFGHDPAHSAVSSDTAISASTAS